MSMSTPHTPSSPSVAISVQPALGVALTLAAAALWGTTGTAQSLSPSGLSPYWMGALRLLVSAGFFAAVLWWLSRLSAPSVVSVPWGAVALGALCMSAYNLSFFAGVKSVGVAVGTAIALGSGPLWAGLLQALVSRSSPPALWWLGTALAVGGGMLMLLAGRAADAPPWTPTGVALCLTAGLSYAVYTLVNERLVRVLPPARATAWVFSGAALLALPLAAVINGLPSLQQISVATVAVVLWLGVMSTGVAFLLFSHALKHISAATGVALALAEPVVAFALAVLVVGERPGPWALLGLACVLAGLAVVVRSEMLQKSSY
jgi:drug/metabolite transporter, DME family